MNKVALIMSPEEAMKLPLEERPICFRISSETYHAVFQAVGAASVCWKPRPGANCVFDSEKASEIALDLCFQIAKEKESIEKTAPPKTWLVRFWRRFFPLKGIKSKADGSMQVASLCLFFILCSVISLFAQNGQPYRTSLEGNSVLPYYKIDCPPLMPDPVFTYGVTMTNVTVEQLCTKGYANVFNGGVRHVPESEKKAVFVEYFGIVPKHPGDFEIDHLISLELGGANDIHNLWPQSYHTSKWNSHTKDALEDRMASLLRHSLKEEGHDKATALMVKFQHEIAENWTNAYIKYVGQPK